MTDNFNIIKEYMRNLGIVGNSEAALKTDLFFDVQLIRRGKDHPFLPAANYSMLNLNRQVCPLLTSCFTEPLLFSELFPVGSSTVGFSTSLDSGVLHPTVLLFSSNVLNHPI